jgi:multiple sugar transport system permease protein
MIANLDKRRLSALSAGSLRWLVLATTAVIILLPFLWIASASLKRRIDILMSNVWSRIVFTNYDEVLFSSVSDYISNYQNSMIVAVVSTTIVLTIASMSGYALFRLSWPRWIPAVLLTLTVMFHMLPPTVISAAWFVIFQRVGLVNTYMGLILAHVTLNIPMGLWLMSAFVRDVPKELEEAAVVDGATPAQVYFRIVLPLLRPGLIATGILVFIFSWNEFAVALSLTAKATQTVPVGIAKFAQEFEIQFGEMAAAAVLSTVPAMILLVLGQRHIIKGLTSGALK